MIHSDKEFTFERIKKTLANHRIRRVALQYLDPEIVDQLLQGDQVPRYPAEREICFAVIQFYPASVADLQNMHASASEIAKTFGADIETFLSHLSLIHISEPTRPY